MPIVPRKHENLTEELFRLISEIIATSPDFSCFASESFLAKTLHRRKADIHAAKLELIGARRVLLSFRSNGRRRNLRHRLTLPPPQHQPPQSSALCFKSRVPDQVPDCGSCGARPLVGMALWPEMPRLDQIDCYLRSGWNACPLKPFSKVPVYTRARWGKMDREGKIDVFHHNQDYGVGLWLEADTTVFDFDSARPVEYDTLIASRGDHHHAYFQGHEEIYNTSKEVAADIDTRACGGLIVLPPTVHKTGQRYEWESLRNPVPVPSELLELWHNRKSRRGGTVFRLGELPAVIPKGERDNTLWSYGRRLRASGVIYDELEMRLRTVNRDRCKPPLGEREISAKIRHIWKHRNDPLRWSDQKLQQNASGKILLSDDASQGYAATR